MGKSEIADAGRREADGAPGPLVESFWNVDPGGLCSCSWRRGGRTSTEEMSSLCDGGCDGQIGNGPDSLPSSGRGMCGRRVLEIPYAGHEI